jgi:putative tryptophan/tyrosine transport system substrate-binding protein
VHGLVYAYQLRNAAFLQALGELGWIVGRNVHIDYRWGAGDVERYRAIATDLISLAPDATSLPSHITPIVKPNIRDSTTTPELGSQ